MESIDKKAKSVKACETCKKPFGLTRIRHTCKRCNKIICADCTKGRIKIVTYDLKNAHKVCIACEKEHGYQVKFAASNQTSWNKLSKIGTKWLEVCNPKAALAKSEDGSEETYKGLLATANDPNTANPHFTAINTDITQGKADREKTNYSLQGFLYSNQGPAKPDQIRSAVSNVLKAFAVKFPSIGYQQGMINVCVFLLSMMDEESAFWSLGYLVTKILPNGFYGQTSATGASLSGCQQEKFVLGNLIKETLGLSPELMGKVNGILDMSTPAMLLTLLINCTNFEVSFEAWNKMWMTKSFNEIRKVVIQVFKSFLPRIKESGAMNIIEFKLMVIGLFSGEEFKEAQSLKISDEQIKDLETRFHTEFEGSAANAGEIYDAIVELTKFNKLQIISLQQGFNRLAMGRLRRPSMIKPNQSMSMTEESHGISREEFKKVLTEEMSGNEESKVLFESLNLDQIYDAFDRNKTGSLDFEEFLFVLSMMMQGNFQDKMQTAFYVFDEQERGHLSTDEFEQFVFVLTQVMTRANQNNMPASFNDDLEKFSEQMTKLASVQEKIDFAQFYPSLIHSNFVKYCADLAKSSQPEPDSDFAKPQKEGVMTDSSVVYNNQTMMESTQDNSHVLHMNRDLTRIFDQSTVQEVEGSKFEEDQSQIEDLLTEEQKEKILGLEQEGTDSQNYLGSKEHLSKDATPVVGKQEEAAAPEIKLESKAKVDSDSDNEEAMMALMQKWKKSPTKKATSPEPKTMTEAVDNEGLALSPQKVQAAEEEPIYDNFLSPVALDKVDMKADLFFNFEKFDACLSAHSNVECIKTIPSCFASNFLAPLSSVEKDFQPVFDDSLFEKTCAALENPKSIVSPQLAVKKLTISEGCQPLSLDEAPSKQMGLVQGWKEGCFEALEAPLMAVDVVTRSVTIEKPFLSNSCKAIIGEHHEPRDEKSNGLWNLEKVEQGDQVVEPLQPVLPSKAVTKPTFGFGPCKEIAADPLPQALSQFPDIFAKTDISLPVMTQPISRVLSVPKPFMASNKSAQPLEPASVLLEKASLEVSKEGFFESLNEASKPIEVVVRCAVIQKPFATDCGLAPCQPESSDRSRPTLNWKESCFEVVDAKPVSIEPVLSGQSIKKSVVDSQPCELLLPHRRNSQAPVLAWKEDVFSLMDKQVMPLDVCERDLVLNKPFADNHCRALLNQDTEEASNLVHWNHAQALFENVDKTIPGVQAQVNIHQAIRKPFYVNIAEPLTQESCFGETHTLEFNFESSISAFSVPHSHSAVNIQGSKLEKLIIEECAQPLEADRDDREDEMIIALEESDAQEKVEVQEVATTSNKAEKIEMPLYENYSVPVYPDEPDYNNWEGTQVIFEKEEIPASVQTVSSRFPEVPKIEQKVIYVEVSHRMEEMKMGEEEKSNYGGAGTVVLDQSGSTKSYRSTVDYQEREREFAQEETEVIEEVVLRTGHHEIGKRLADMEKEKAETQGGEPAGRTSLKTNTENVSGKQYIVDEGDDDVDELNGTFVNMDVVNDQTTASPEIISEISEKNQSPQLQNKRKVDASKDSEKEHKGDSCKTCSVF